MASVPRRVCWPRGENDAALGPIRQALDIVNETDYLELRGETFTDLAEVLISADGDRQPAVEALRQAIVNFDAKGARIQSDAFEDFGSHELKGLPGARQLYLVSLG
ncbi:MAG: hypothetical protein QFC55_02470 [Chloroflexota bacterium]|nr:hypothetical protein [Chloroflexota bacterium]